MESPDKSRPHAGFREGPASFAHRLGEYMHSDLRPQKGFTLVEVLAVLIIVAILAGVGTPIYLNYIKSARSADAQTTISAIVTAEKINYQKTGRYLNDLESLRKGGVQIDEATELNWKFDIGASEQQCRAVRAIAWNTRCRRGNSPDTG
jgi:prepilin-type N-terminal cleavage/methylation domain-containing protein